MEFDDLVDKINDLKLSNENCVLKQKSALIDSFNKINEQKFKFQFNQNKLENRRKLGDFVLETLVESGECLRQLKNDNKTDGADEHISLMCSCLDLVRLISRDTDLIESFQNDLLLAQIQQLANLDRKLFSSSRANNANNNKELLITFNALKAMSNLIYNSKFVQDYYAQNCVAETITIHLKQFTPSDLTSSDSTNFNIMLFNLKISFLLTVFNKSLRLKLREKLQIVTYLIEIIDQIMKERLVSNEASVLSEDEDPSNTGDFCYLKRVDVDFLIEILKILYNLTMDIQTDRQSAFSNNSTQPQKSNYLMEEEEAHLMHLVSVLRDLITCKLEGEEEIPWFRISLTSKLNDLHSNIINLLTNMPTICYEELMAPCCQTSSAALTPTSNEPVVSKFNARHEHNKKRMSRRSKRIKAKQDCKVNKSADIEASQHAHDDLENDLEFEGKNMEAIAIILSFMNRHATNYLPRSGLPTESSAACRASPNERNADHLYPVMMLLSLMSKANKQIRNYCKLKVLPPLKRDDIVYLPQIGATIRNKLVKLMTDSNLQIKRLCAQFLFILCKESVSRLVKYTGYGNAAGLLAEAGLMLSTHGDRSAYSSDSDDSDTEEYKQLEECINPITGRAEVDETKKGKKDLFEGMSEEQKEFEAIKLVNAIDKLTRISGGGIKPATIGLNGKPVEIEHVLQLQENDNSILLGSKPTAKKNADD